MVFAFTSNGLHCHPDHDEASATLIESCSFKRRSCVINCYYSCCLSRLQFLIDGVCVCVCVCVCMCVLECHMQAIISVVPNKYNNNILSGKAFVLFIFPLKSMQILNTAVVTVLHRRPQ